MLTTYNLKMPHAVYGGENAMDNITAILKLNGGKSAWQCSLTRESRQPVCSLCRRRQ